MRAPARTALPSLRRQTTWLFAAKAISLALTVVVPILLVRLLNQTEYGLYRQGFLLLTTALAVLTFNYQYSAYYYFPQSPQRRLTAAWNAVLFEAMAGIAVFAVLAAWPRSVGWILGTQELVVFGPLFGLILLFQCPGLLLEHFATADQNVRLSTLFIIGANVSRGALLLAAGLWAPRAGILFAAALAQSVLQVAALLVYLRASFPRGSLRFDPAFFKEQFYYVLPMALNSLLYMIELQAHNYVVAHRFTVAEYAIYAVGCFQVPFSALVRESLGTVLIPRVSALKTQGDTAEIRRLLAAATSRLALVNCGVVGLMASFGEDTIRFLFSDRYRASWPVFAVNLLYLLIEIPITDPASRAYPEILRKTLRLRLLTAPLSTIVMAWFAWRGGLVCVVAVAVGVILIEKACACWWVARTIGFPAAERSRWRTLPLAAAIGLGAAVAAAGARSLLSGSHLLLRLAAAGAVFGGLYAWMVWRNGLVPEEDKARVLDLAARLRLRRSPRTPVG